MNTQNKTKGFTIIEVVLVLAIAGLIFLMVFLALPALQRNQRDQQRSADLGRLISAVQSYRSNNQGKRPLDLGGPAGDDYTLAAGSTTAVPQNTRPSAETVINYYANRACDSATANSGKMAIVIWQENSNQRCQEL